MFETLEDRWERPHLTVRNAAWMVGYVFLFGMLVGVTIARRKWDLESWGMILLQAGLLYRILAPLCRDLDLLLKNRNVH